MSRIGSDWFIMMQKFYNKALIGLLCLLTASLLAGYGCIERSHLHVALLPMGESAFPWRAEASSDATEGGSSTIGIHADQSRLRFHFAIAKTVDYPFAAAALAFTDSAGKAAAVDLSRFTSISFRARCSPANTLALAVPTFDAAISTPGNLLSYRTPSAFFSCNESGAPVELDLTRLETPQWWFDMFKLDLSRKAYKLDQVPKISIGTTFQSPAHKGSMVELAEITLHGRDDRYLYLFGGFLIIVWAGYGYWFFRRHTRTLIGEVKDKLQRDLPLVAYQQLSLEPYRDKEKSTILRCIATGYANADLDLDTFVTQTGVNRNKINDILKAELGYTFTAYLNKLRLTEAARLLAEKDGANVAEIAYSVGYKNVSYFNKLFKEEYSCTPRAFRTLSSG